MWYLNSKDMHFPVDQAIQHWTSKNSSYIESFNCRGSNRGKMISMNQLWRNWVKNNTGFPFQIFSRTLRRTLIPYWVPLLNCRFRFIECHNIFRKKSRCNSVLFQIFLEWRFTKIFPGTLEVLWRRQRKRWQKNSSTWFRYFFT